MVDHTESEFKLLLPFDNDDRGGKERLKAT
jgi:hypothetical protein